MYRAKAHEYINEQLKESQKTFLPSLVYYQSPCKISNVMIYPLKNFWLAFVLAKYSEKNQHNQP